MNLQGCLYFQNRRDLEALYQSEPVKLLDFSNKFRAFVFVLEDHYRDVSEFEQTLSATTVLPLYELLPQYMTHIPGKDEAIHHPIIIDKVTPYWTADIDAFIALPKSFQQKLVNWAPYVSFYQDLQFLEKFR